MRAKGWVNEIRKSRYFDLSAQREAFLIKIY